MKCTGPFFKIFLSVIVFRLIRRSQSRRLLSDNRIKTSPLFEITVGMQWNDTSVSMPLQPLIQQHLPVFKRFKRFPTSNCIWLKHTLDHQRCFVFTRGVNAYVDDVICKKPIIQTQRSVIDSLINKKRAGTQ